MSRSDGSASDMKSAFYVGQRVKHRAKGHGTVGAVDMHNLRGRPYEVVFDDGTSHQYTETAMMQKFTAGSAKNDFLPVDDAATQLAVGADL